MVKLSELRTIDDIAPDLPPATCEQCGREIQHETMDYRTCRVDLCMVVLCPCGREFASFGPVGCPACSPYRWPRIRQIRHLYSRRHRRGPRWR